MIYYDWARIKNVLDRENKRQGGKWYPNIGVESLPKQMPTSLGWALKLIHLLNYRNPLVPFSLNSQEQFQEYMDSIADAVFAANNKVDLRTRLFEVVFNVVLAYDKR